MKPVTVSVVSHQQMHLLSDLFEDLNRCCSGLVEEVVLTSNLPEAMAIETAHLAFPVRRIINSHPQGFGANHNRAFQGCHTPWCLVINPDVRWTTNVMGDLLARAHARTAVLAPQETGALGVPIDHPRGLITPWGVIKRQALHQPAPTPDRHGWVKGMFMLMRSQAFREVRGFDEGFFLYCEDFDLCARMMLKGWTVDHHPDISLQHLWQRDSRRSLFHLRHHLSSLARMWRSPVFWQYRRLLQQSAGGGLRGL